MKKIVEFFDKFEDLLNARGVDASVSCRSSL